MNEKISALMDGELDRDEAMQVIRGLGSDAARRESWDHYHLIGETLRGATSGEVDRRQRCAATIFAKLAQEPTVLAPSAIRVAPVDKRTRMALAMAASVVTVSAIAVVAFKQQSGTVEPVQLVQKVAPRPVAASPNAAEVRVNDYLAIHRQFTNPEAFQAASARREAGR
ncbi:MAG: sigma-E factor negative regulatory protein [Burkholderiales bacterium]|jgi:sigma-E factor negative regulatory protein RseA|nr:sigma-E factor negative regulatory protein [Rhodocyclaceae bacterium]MCE2724297.1 sigma-E factor negative regulatory protein [Betaproteobacteria bacterium]MCA3019073.1 sigma-E factor negative regulatory protein [Rhodocyclaceae bacterium]MCA3023318.1 sigma-E factor negative regulatory protein [Rhodocyclaceae bacterium]MCA3024653.1 sigma-E factor negative regulatory protein [Rhodocyclaceae bacterium]